MKLYDKLLGVEARSIKKSKIENQNRHVDKSSWENLKKRYGNTSTSTKKNARNTEQRGFRIDSAEMVLNLSGIFRLEGFQKRKNMWCLRSVVLARGGVVQNRSIPSL